MEKILQPTHKQLRRIAAIRSAEQITKMSSQSIKVLTNDFEEQYVRMIIARMSTADEQLQGLNSIKKAFDSFYMIEDGFVDSFYDRDLPAYFGELSLDLELGILVTAPSSPVEPPTEEATPADWIKAAKSMNDELEFSDYQMRDILCTMSTLSKERIEMLDSMRNGMLKKLTDELDACKARNKELEALVDGLKEEMAQLKLEEQESLEPSPYQKAMAYENVIYYIASRPLKHKREDLINMLEALLPKEMHAKLRNDIEEKVEARDAEKASKRRKSKASARIIAQSGSTVNIIDGTNINHAENVNSK
jgi:hypothetical protein